MNLIRKHLILSSLILLILLSLLFILGETAVKEVVQYIPPPQSQLAQVSSTLSDNLLTHSTAGSTDLNFDGAKSVDLGTLTQLDGATKATWAFWVKPSALNNGSTFVSKVSNNNSQYAWWITIPTSGLGAGNDEVALYFAPAVVAYTNTNPGFLNVTSWHHIAFVYDGEQSSNADRIKVYVNGSPKNLFIVGTIPTSLPVTTSRATLGSVSDGGRFLTGSMDDVRVYSRALGASEVQQLYASYVPGGSGGEPDPEPEDDTDPTPETEPNPQTPPPPVIVPVPAPATTQTYWVSPTGTALWTNCRSDTPLDGVGACSISIASKNAIAGDTVYLRGGTYVYTNAYSATIFPAQSGTVSQPIVFKNYNAEQVILDGNNVQWSYGIFLSNKSHIHISGVTLKNFVYTFVIDNSSYNVASNINAPNILIYHNSKHNWIHDSVFSKSGSVLYNYPGLPKCSPQGLNMQIGDISATWLKKDFSSYNLIENNTFFHGAHDNAEIRAPYNVIRNNYWHNEDWMDTPADCGIPGNKSGNRLVADFGPMAYRNLYEGNRIGYSGIGVDYKQGGEGLELTGNRSIVRRNLVYKAKGAGIYPYNKNLGADLPAGNNYIYLNTVYRNGYDGMGVVKFAGIQFAGSSNNVIKNNIVFDNFNGPFGASGPTIPQTYGTNWTDTNGDPLFVNTTAVNPFDSTLPDLRVKSNSPVIDAGGWLTIIMSSSGSGNTFTVADANYFMDGWGMVRVPGDTIQLEGQNITAKITNINYDTNTITVDRSLTWTTGQGISLAYSGSKPDIGAYESGNSGNGAPTCTSFTYSTWGTCSNNTQSRSVTSTTPTSCTGGIPVLTQSCTLNTPLPGDFNSDNKVNSLDFSALSSKWNQPSPTHDLNKDGTVNSLDFSLMAQNWTG